MEIPERLAGRGIQREDVALVATAEDQAAGRGHHARPRRGMQHEFPLLPAGQDVERPDRTRSIVALQRLLATAEEGFAFFVFHVGLVVDRAHQANGNEELFRLRVVGRAEPVGRALKARPDQVAVVGRLRSRQDDRPARLVEPRRPGLLRILVAVQEFAGFAIE